MKTMYDPMVNSPATRLGAAIGAGTTSIAVADASCLPPAPNMAMIGTGETTETILYKTLSGNTLSGVTRGFQGTAAAWSAGTPIARLVSAYDFTAFKENIIELRHIVIRDTIPANAWQLNSGYYVAKRNVSNITSDMNMTIGLSNISSIKVYSDMGVFYGETYDGGYSLMALNSPETGTSITIFAEAREVY